MEEKRTKDEIIKEASSRLANIFVDLIDEKENKKKELNKSISKNEHNNNTK